MPVVYDNLSTGLREAVKWGPFIEGDIADRQALAGAFARFKPIATIHFAGSAYVGESVTDPAKYYRNNVVGTQSLLDACCLANVRKFVFSSSCATYGTPQSMPVKETVEQRPINPYGRTKLICEQMLTDYAAAYDMRFASLRYFNAAGADPHGELGERHDPETHLIPLALMAAAGIIDSLQIYGDDYDTPDGTCIRDYTHVTDLARAHTDALRYLDNNGPSLCANLGTGTGFSIREIISAIEEITGLSVPVKIAARRIGDPPILVAEAALARKEFGFRTDYSDIQTIIRTAADFMGIQAKSGRAMNYRGVRALHV
jgi:UDP-arabinose 4-epimerase